MTVNATNAMQAAMLRSMSGNTGIAGSNYSSSFSSMLMEALLESKTQGLSSGYTSGSSPMFGDTSAYALMAMMLGSGSGSGRSMAMMSLYNALKGEASSFGFAGARLNPYFKGRYSNEYLRELYANALAEVPGKGTIPSRPGRPVDPALTSNILNRSASRYTSVINQFSVETRARYQPDGGTYCNIFVWDVTKAMGAEIPHYFNAKTGKPMSFGDKGANQMNANAMYNWLHKHGDQYGWFEVTPKEAQELANQGHPVVTALYRSGAHGHVQIVCPSKDGIYDEKRGVTVAQAGRRLTSYRPITQLYSKSSLSKVSYFAHM